MARQCCNFRVAASCQMAFVASVPLGYNKSRWAEEIFEVLLEETEDPRHSRLNELVGPNARLPMDFAADWGPYQISFRISPELLDKCQAAAAEAGQLPRAWMRNVLYRACLFSVDWHDAEKEKNAENTD